MTSKYDEMVEVVTAPLIINKKGEILLIRSQKWGDEIYLLPGGHVERGETIQEAVIREGEEETGLKIKPVRLLNVGELIDDPKFERKAHLVYFHFLAEMETTEINKDDREVSDILWIDPQEALDTLDLLDDFRVTIQNYVDGVDIPLSSTRFEQ